MDNYSLSDISAVTRNSGYSDGWDGFGGSGAWVLILLFAMIFGWGGNGWGNRGANGEPVTEAGLCNAMNFNNLENAVGRLNDSQQAGFNGIQRDLCQGFAAINAGINQVRFDNQQCCCETQRAIDGVNYNGAMNTAAINANTTAGIQKVLDKLCENETNALRARVQQLELQGALCGVIRYPTMTTYATNCNPFFSGCGCNGNI